MERRVDDCEGGEAKIARLHRREVPSARETVLATI